MNETLAKELKIKANELGEILTRNSYKGAETNPSFEAEEFIVDEIHLSAATSAVITYIKSGGKKVATIFYYVRNGGWQSTIPTDHHLTAYKDFFRIKAEVEKFNYQVSVKGLILPKEKKVV